jgi:hypothetical protein
LLILLVNMIYAPGHFLKTDRYLNTMTREMEAVSWLCFITAE